MPNTRLPLIAGNWKMNTTVAEARALAKALASNLNGAPGVEVLLCPPFISLTTVGSEISGTTLKLGAQNLHPEPKGAFTGEVSPAMLSGLCDYVIVGHSERRALFGEDDDFVNRKLHAALTHDITPILCVGETLAQRESNTTEEVLTRQVIGGLKDVPPEADFVVAYEPVWAIGTGKAASASDAEQAISLIRQTLSQQLGEQAAAGTRILYGGSVKSSNISDFITSDDIDGALVGGASLDPDDFSGIVSATSQARPD